MTWMKWGRGSYNCHLRENQQDAFLMLCGTTVFGTGYIHVLKRDFLVFVECANVTYIKICPTVGVLPGSSVHVHRFSKIRFILFILLFFNWEIYFK